MNSWSRVLFVVFACSAVVMSCGTFESRDSGEIKFSGVGGSVLFTSAKSGSLQLYSMNIDGTDVQQLTDDPAFPVTFALWSPTGQDILIGSQPTGDGWSGGSYFYLVEPDGSNLRSLFNETSVANRGGGTWPVWSPDGSKIVYRHHCCGDSGYYGVGLIDLEQRSNSLIWKHLRRVHRTVWDWSEDGSRLLGTTRKIVRDSEGTSHDRSYLTIWSTNGDSLSSFELRNGSVSMGKWSPDENFVAIDARRYKDIFLGVLQQSNSDLTEWPLDDFYQTSPIAWSQDRTKILASALKPPTFSNYRILLIDVATGAYEDISPFDDASTQVWSWNQNK